MTHSLPVRAASDPVRWAFLTGVRLLRAGKASLLLRDATDPVLVVAASIGIDPEIIPQIRVPVGRGIAGVVADRGATFFGSRDDKTFISVPIRSAGGIEGVLNVTDREGGEEFGDEHVEQAQAVASHLARLLDYDRHAVHDVDSGLPNRQAFLDMLERELARSKRVGRPFGVAALTLTVRRDGQSNPDAVLQAAGRALQGALRRYDYAGHAGNGRFFVLLGIPFEEARNLEPRLVTSVTAAARAMDADVDVQFGLARCPDDGTEAHALMAVAEYRLDRAR